MRRIVTAIFLVVIAVTCDDPIKDDPSKIADGVYIGTFIRTPAWMRSDSANVTITFNDNSWTGQSDRINFPVLGEGTYKIENELMFFTNLIEVSPGVDTTLILSGRFQFTKNKTQLEIYRYYFGWGFEMSDEDRYILVKK